MTILKTYYKDGLKFALIRYSDGLETTILYKYINKLNNQL